MANSGSGGSGRSGGRRAASKPKRTGMQLVNDRSSGAPF